MIVIIYYNRDFYSVHDDFLLFFMIDFQYPKVLITNTKTSLKTYHRVTINDDIHTQKERRRHLRTLCPIIRRSSTEVNISGSSTTIHETRKGLTAVSQPLFFCAAMWMGQSEQKTIPWTIRPSASRKALRPTPITISIMCFLQAWFI